MIVTYSASVLNLSSQLNLNDEFWEWRNSKDITKHEAYYEDNVKYLNQIDLFEETEQSHMGEIQIRRCAAALCTTLQKM